MRLTLPSLRLGLVVLAVALIAIPLSATSAHAERTHGFKGRTKFDRAHNELRADFRVVVAPGASAAGVSVHAHFDMLDSDAVLDGTATTGEDAKVRFVAQVEPDFGPYKVGVEYGGVFQSMLFDALPVDKGATLEASGELGVSVRLSATDAGGGVAVTVANADPAWDPGKLGAVTLSDGAGPAALEDDGMTVKYTVSLGYTPPCDLAGERGICVATIRKADGTLLDSQLDLQVFSAEGCGLELGRLSVDETPRGDVKVVAYSRAGAHDGPSFLAVAVTDDATGEALLDVAASAPTGVERQFAASALTFEDPQAALGESYGVVLELVTQDGRRAYAEVNVVVEGPGAGFVASLEGGGEVTGLASIHTVNGVAFELFVAVTSGEVARVGAQFVDTTGPAPVPTELALPLVQEWQKWVFKGRAGVGSAASGGMLSTVVTLSDARGAIRDVRGGSVPELPTVLFSNGQGTKYSTSSASTKPQLL